jgi:pimeloyl-ACP methyl ester carboxylesterase
MIDVGSGPPLVLIPGIQGRWEWMKPLVTALAGQRRIITDSLPGEPGSAACLNDECDFDAFVSWVDGLLDAAHVPRAVICGVSFGGLIAVRYAARRPERVQALILVSAVGPRWKPEPRQARYMAWPILSSPFFAMRAVRLSWAELRVTHPGLGARLTFCVRTISRVLRAPAVPWRMVSRARMAAAENFEGDCARVSAPTLVVTGERDLDSVVRQDDTMSYLTAIGGARYELFDRTGHLGTISAPERFAAIVSRFLNG